MDDSDDSEDDLTDDDGDDEAEFHQQRQQDSDNESNSSKKKISPEARFTRRFTQFYDLLGCYFPVLLRLRELVKLNAISRILKQVHRGLEKQKRELTPPRGTVREILVDIRHKITYPICTESKVSVEFIFLQFIFDEIFCVEFFFLIV